jgi:hypothetical protein
LITPVLRSAAPALLALIGALLIAWLASKPPQPLSSAADPGAFSSGRAMSDVREMAKAPRPAGSAENARVRAHLAARMRQIGMIVAEQSGPIPEQSAERLAKWGGDPATARVVNVIGMLPGRDRTKPALMLMAHHDSVWASPGAPDDAAGVAAALEIARALTVRGVPERDVVLLFTDAEEIGLDGAELFFERHPLARRIGAVINMEARGGGGRAAMFETGRGNSEWIRLYRQNVSRPASNSLAVLVYELMPNNTDFTIPKKMGLPGFNFAFIGKAHLYHSPMATAEALEEGALQDMGSQALDVVAPLAFARELPGRGDNAVFGDVLGLFVIAYSAAVGWLVLGAAVALIAFAIVRVRKRAELGWWDLGGGVACASALLLHSALLLTVANLISGSGGATNYYDRLAALPRLELQAFLICLALLLLAPIAARPAARLIAAAPALLLTFVGIIFAGLSPILMGLGIAAAVSAMLLPMRHASLWSGWFGLVLLLLGLAITIQIIAPTAGPLLHWPLLLAGIAAATAAVLDPAVQRWPALAVIAAIAVLGAAQILTIAHFTFQGVGAGTPQAMALILLLVALLAWPLVQRAAAARAYAVSAMVLLVCAGGIALSVALDPMAETVPPYSIKS